MAKATAAALDLCASVMGIVASSLNSAMELAGVGGL